MAENKPGSKARLIWELFLTFFRIGAFTFGGGYAMIPIIERDVVEKKKWISSDDLLEIIAIAESTPGPIAVNSATFVGYRVAGVWGALAATLGVVLPSFIIILIISYLLEQFSDLKPVRYAFMGIRAAVLALIFKGWFGMAKKMPRNILTLIVIIASFVLVAFLKIPVFYVLLGCAVFGLVWTLIETKAKGGKKNA